MNNGQQYSETVNLMSKLSTHSILYRADGFGGLSFNVKVLDMRVVWGRTDLLVEPISGTGQRWVAADSCKIMEKGEL